jgi:hypothetical protein
MKGLFFHVFYLFKLIGVKTINDLKRRFGNPHISMPSNSTREDWIKALQNVCTDMHVNLESISYEFVAEENSQFSKILFTHIWFLRPYRNIMIAKEYDIGQPKITVGVLKLNKDN